MQINITKKSLLLAAIILATNDAIMADETVLLRGVPDLEGPVVQHSPINEAAVSDSPLAISATVTDNVGVKYVIVNYRSTGSKEYRQAPMQQISGSLYSVTIPAVHVQNAGIEYYLEATDLSGNTVLRGLDFQPMVIAVSKPEPVSTTSQSSDIQETALIAEPAAKEKSNSWIWWAVGAVVAGSAAYAVTRDSGDGGGEPPTGTLVITSPQPE